MKKLIVVFFLIILSLFCPNMSEGKVKKYQTPYVLCPMTQAIVRVCVLGFKHETKKGCFWVATKPFFYAPNVKWDCEKKAPKKYRKYCKIRNLKKKRLLCRGKKRKK